MLRNSSVAAQLAASQEGLSSVSECFLGTLTEITEFGVEGEGNNYVCVRRT
jgi:hypothetical protein